MKTVKHRWITQDGFRTQKCQYCSCIRKWDENFKKEIFYVDGLHLRLNTPSCKRVYFSDLIPK